MAQQLERAFRLERHELVLPHHLRYHIPRYVVYPQEGRDGVQEIGLQVVVERREYLLLQILEILLRYRLRLVDCDSRAANELDEEIRLEGPEAGLGMQAVLDHLGLQLLDLAVEQLDLVPCLAVAVLVGPDADQVMPRGNQASEEQEVLRAVQLVFVEVHESLNLFEGVELQIVFFEFLRDLRLVDELQELLGGDAEGPAVKDRLCRGLRILCHRLVLSYGLVLCGFDFTRKLAAWCADQEACGIP